MVLRKYLKSIKMYIQLKIDAAAINELKNIIAERVEKVVSKLLQDNKAKPSINTSYSEDELLTRKGVMKMLQISHAGSVASIEIKSLFS